MRKLFIISLLAILGIALNAQQGYQHFAADTVKGAKTHYITSGVNCAYSGYVTFDFSLKGFGTNDSATVTLQGQNDTTWYPVSGQIQAYKNNVTTSYQLTDNPVHFLKYRLKFQGKATDTVKMFNILLIYKR